MKNLTGIVMIICALIIAAFAVSKAVEYKKTIKDAGIANGIVTSVTSDKVIRYGKSHIAYSASVKYEVNGKEYTASIPVRNYMAAEKITVYYDKNSPETVYAPSIGTNDACIFSAILALVGAAVLIWRR